MIVFCVFYLKSLIQFLLIGQLSLFLIVIIVQIIKNNLVDWISFVQSFSFQNCEIDLEVDLYLVVQEFINDFVVMDNEQNMFFLEINQD